MFQPFRTPRRSLEMFDPRNLFGALPPAIVEHQILLVGLAASWLFVAHYNGQTRKVREIMLTRR